MEVLENKEIKVSSRYLHPKETRCFHSNDPEQVNNNRNMIARMLLL